MTLSWNFPMSEMSPHEIVQAVEEMYGKEGGIDEHWFALYSLFLYTEHREEK
jgi:hypothetical protein